MSENNTPVARVLDFSHVGATTPAIRLATLSSIVFPVIEETDEIRQQNALRQQEEAHLPRFAPGMSFTQTPHRSAARQWMLVGNANKIKCRAKFSPKSLDDFYTTRCAPGCTRIFRKLLDNPDISSSNLMVSLPFHKLSQHMFELMNPFNKLPKSNFDPPSVSEFVQSSYIYKKAKAYRTVWESFIHIRYQMRRLLNAWLNKKSQKKILPIPNYETLEDPTPNNCIEWTDITNRCVYRIHGDTLIKSMKMYLHHSDYGFPEPLTPKNPTTNAPFTLGQLIHLVFEIYSWCGKNKKPVPSIITKYHAAKFCLDTLSVKNRPEMTYHSCQDLFKEMADEDAVEMWLDMIEKYAPLPSFCRTRIEREIPLWIRSLSQGDTETNRKGKELLKKWQALLPDVVQLSRFNYYNRQDWTDESQVKRIVKFLWVNTYHQVRIYIESLKVEERAMVRAGELIPLENSYIAGSFLRANRLLNIHNSNFIDSVHDSLLNRIHTFDFILDDFQISNINVVAVPVNPADSFEEVD